MRLFICLLCVFTLNVHLAAQPEPPAGKLLFQPMLIWGDAEVTHQGTGYLIEHDQQTFGVTSVHFLNFEGPGLFEAIWLDIPTYQTVYGFRESLGKPASRSIDTYDDIQHDFILMPAAPNTFADHARLRLDDRAHLQEGEMFWFPNKDFQQPQGHTWVQAQLIKDQGSYLEVKLLEKIPLQSQSGSPLISQTTGQVVGMLMGGDSEAENPTLWFCPARGINTFLRGEHQALPLTESVK